MRRFKVLLIILAFLFSQLIILNTGIVRDVKATEVIYSPTTTTTITAGWTNPTYAFTSDNQYAYAGAVSPAEQEYSGYGISIPSDAQNIQVYVGAERYTTYGSSEDLSVKVYDGANWYTGAIPDSSTEALYWYNFTTATTWTPAKVNSIKTRLYFTVVAGGGDTCFSNNTYLLTYNYTHLIFKPIATLVKGDCLFARNSSGFYVVPVIDVLRHEGTFEVLRITVNKPSMFKVKDYTIRFNWNESIEITPNHPIFNPKTKTKVPAGNLSIGDMLTDLNLGGFINVTIVNIEKFIANVTYDFKVPPEYANLNFFGIALQSWQVSALKQVLGDNWNVWKYPEQFSCIGLIIKATYYVDWIPVKIVYTTTAQQISQTFTDTLKPTSTPSVWQEQLLNIMDRSLTSGQITYACEWKIMIPETVTSNGMMKYEGESVYTFIKKQIILETVTYYQELHYTFTETLSPETTASWFKASSFPFIILIGAITITVSAIIILWKKR